MLTNQVLALKDTRDNNSYTVAKLLDGRCWMTQNLKIIDKLISDIDSDIASDTYKIPASSRDFSKNEGAYYDSSYGSFYSHYVATAGTSTNYSKAPSSICPKSFHLPTQEEWSEFFKYYNVQSGQQSPPSFSFDTSMCGNNGTPCWGSHGERHSYWWASTSMNSNNGNSAFGYSGNFYVHDRDNGNGKTAGFHVRCMSDY